MADRPMTMVEAFARYCALYVPDAGDLDTMTMARLKGAFAEGMILGMTAAALPDEQASELVAKWQGEIAAYWSKPGP